VAGQSCAHCGSGEHLEFHHEDPAQKVSHRVTSWAPARQRAELAKCMVLCHRCHVAEGRRAGHYTRHARLSPEAVQLIRCADPSKDEALASRFGVTVAAIRSARTGRTWGWVDSAAA